MEYITTNTVELFTGEIGLSEKQAAVRTDKLKRVRKGLYEIIKPVQFKAGEKIKLSKLPKGLGYILEEAGAKAKAEAKKKAEVEKAKAEAEKAEAEAEKAEAEARKNKDNEIKQKARGYRNKV